MIDDDDDDLIIIKKALQKGNHIHRLTALLEHMVSFNYSYNKMNLCCSR